MSVRSLRVLALIAVAGLLALALLVANAASPPGAIAQSRADRVLLTHCVEAVLGAGRGRATPDSGSADPQVVSHLAVFRRTRSAADTLPAAAYLRAALAGAGAGTYDPSAAVRLQRNGAHGAIYAVPAMIALLALPAGCNGLPQFAGDGAYLAFRTDEIGSGPGACLISTELLPSGPSGVSLPGQATPKPTQRLAVTGAACRSEAIISGYVGALGDQRLGSAHELALIPDGVSAITYALADGRQFTAQVVGNLVTPPVALSIPPTAHPLSAAEFGQQLAAHLPTTVTETGAGAQPIATLTRPGSLIADTVASFSFLHRLLSSSSLTLGSSSSSISSSNGASCSAQTHRCVAVIVMTTCNSRERCSTSRTIHRYRYVGAKPPPGTTGPDTQPTGPIVGRVNRVVTRPTKLTLVLGGAPHRKVVVLLSVSCFSRNSGEGSGGPPLHVAVPSRTPISLPTNARAFQSCDVGALVISRQRGSVRVTVARG